MNSLSSNFNRKIYKKIFFYFYLKIPTFIFSFITYRFFFYIISTFFVSKIPNLKTDNIVFVRFFSIIIYEKHTFDIFERENKKVNIFERENKNRYFLKR